MTQIQTQQQQSSALTVAFERNRAALSTILGSERAAAKWAEVAIDAFRNPTVAKSTPDSVIACVYRAAKLGLPIDGVHFSLVPFFNKKENSYECVGIVGYPGWVAIYTRHAGVSHVRAKVVFEGDKFLVEEGTQTQITHVPDPKGNHTSPEKVVAAYAVAHLTRGGFTFVVMWKDELEALRARCITKAGSRPTPWSTDPIEMMRKSPILRLRKGLTLTEDVQEVLAEVERDEVVMDVEGEQVTTEPITSMDQLKESLAPIEEGAVIHSTPAEVTLKRTVKGVQITLTEHFDEWSQRPFTKADKVADSSPISGRSAFQLIEGANDVQIAEIKRLVTLGQGHASPHVTIQKAALILNQIEPDITDDPL